MGRKLFWEAFVILLLSSFSAIVVAAFYNLELVPVTFAFGTYFIGLYLWFKCFVQRHSYPLVSLGGLVLGVLAAAVYLKLLGSEQNWLASESFLQTAGFGGALIAVILTGRW